MWKGWLAFAPVAAFGALLCTTAHATPALSPTRSFALLGGRLTIQLARNSESSARPAESIMSADPSTDRETRIVTPLAGGTLVFFVKETYRTAGASDQPLLAALTDAALDAHPIAGRVGALRVIRQSPSKWAEVVSGGLLVEAALIVLPDETVINAAYYVNPSVKNRSALRDFARASLATLTFQRKLATGGDVAVAGITVKLPERWIHWEQQGPDFSVHHFARLAAWGAPTATVGVYEGGHASYQHAQDETKPHFETRPGKWLGRDVTWHVSGVGADRLDEAILAVAPGVRHVWYSGDEARTVVEGMRLKQP